MSTMANPLDDEATMSMPDAATDVDSTRNTWLLPNPRGGQLTTRSNTAREWQFPDSDELFRGIYTRAGIGFASDVVAVCSAVVGEGTTTLCIGLAVTLAQDFPERRVLLVETDLQRPVLAEEFGAHSSPGLVDCLVKGEPLLSACQPTFLDNLHVLPAGTQPSMSGRPLRSNRMAAIVDAMRQSYDVVILDLPAILANSDAILLTDLADGVICVVRAGSTPMALLNRAVEQLEQVKLRGVVINGSKSAVPGWLRRVVGV